MGKVYEREREKEGEVTQRVGGETERKRKEEVCVRERLSESGKEGEIGRKEAKEGEKKGEGGRERKGERKGETEGEKKEGERKGVKKERQRGSEVGIKGKDIDELKWEKRRTSSSKQNLERGDKERA